MALLIVVAINGDLYGINILQYSSEVWHVFITSNQNTDIYGPGGMGSNKNNSHEYGEDDGISWRIFLFPAQGLCFCSVPERARS